MSGLLDGSRKHSIYGKAFIIERRSKWVAGWVYRANQKVFVNGSSSARLPPPGDIVCGHSKQSRSSWQGTQSISPWRTSKDWSTPTLRNRCGFWFSDVWVQGSRLLSIRLRLLWSTRELSAIWLQLQDGCTYA
jgi:hypothetical protein